MSRRVVAAYEPDAKYNLNRLSNLVPREGFSALSLVGLLNSTFYNWLFLTRFFDYEVKPVYLRKSPLPVLGEEFEQLCADRYKATAALPAVSLPSEQTRLHRKIERLDAQVDDAVFAALGLSIAECELVVSEHDKWWSYGSSEDVLDDDEEGEG